MSDRELLWICNDCGDDFFTDEDDPECPYCYSMDVDCCEEE